MVSWESGMESWQQGSTDDASYLCLVDDDVRLELILGVLS